MKEKLPIGKSLTLDLRQTPDGWSEFMKQFNKEFNKGLSPSNKLTGQKLDYIWTDLDKK